MFPNKIYLKVRTCTCKIYTKKLVTLLAFFCAVGKHMKRNNSREEWSWLSVWGNTVNHGRECVAVGSFMVAGVCIWDLLSPIFMEKEGETGQVVGLSYQLSSPISRNHFLQQVSISWRFHNFPKQWHSLKVRCLNTGAHGWHFTFKILHKGKQCYANRKLWLLVHASQATRDLC